MLFLIAVNLRMNSSQRGGRTRTGCWTCRKRKKRCDGDGVPCSNCSRLGIACDVKPRLVWQDDPRRQGMSRRGPKKSDKPNNRASEEVTSDAHKDTTSKVQGSLNITPLLGGSPRTTSLTSTESILLDHYIQRFSRTYPTCQEPTNPFLSTLLPFALQNKIVLDALLALSGAQRWESDNMTMEDTTLQLRHRALRGCQILLSQPKMKTYMDTQSQKQTSKGLVCGSEVLPVIACCVLLLLYEKLVGNGKSNWMPHLSFLATMFERLSSIKEPVFQQNEQSDIYQFLYNLFLYNDLIHSTATGTTTLSDYYLTSIMSTYLPPDGSMVNRLYYPCLVARIAASGSSITDADIDAWDGRLDWLPSFSSTPHMMPDPNNVNGSSEIATAAQLYRHTAKIFLIQSARRRQRGEEMTMQHADTSIFAERATTSLSNLPEGCSFENALLWPISIFARELTKDQCPQRKYIMHRLQQLERRFHMRHFKRMQEVLEAAWTRLDEQSLNMASNVEKDIFLLG